MAELGVVLLDPADVILSTGSLLPRILRAWQYRPANDISATWLVAAPMSTVIWVAHCNLINALALVLVSTIYSLRCAYISLIELHSEPMQTFYRSGRLRERPEWNVAQSQMGS